MLEALAEVNHMIAMSLAEKHYLQNMEQICGGDNPYVNPKNLMRFHQRFKKEAKDLFDKVPKMGNKEYGQQFSQRLNDRLDRHYEHFEAQNANKDWFRSAKNHCFTTAIRLSFTD